MGNLGDQTVVLEQDVLGQIWKDYDISLVLCDEEVGSNEESSGILAWGCSSLKSGGTNPEIVFDVVNSVLLEREGLGSLGEDISFRGSARMTRGGSGSFVTGICDRSKRRMFYGLPDERQPIGQRLSRRDLVAREERTWIDWLEGGLAGVGSI